MTSKIVKYFIAIIVSLSLLSCMPFAFGVMPMFALSLWGVKHFFIWQLFSHAFLYPSTPGSGIHISYLINLAFNMFILWRLGVSISYHKGVKHFLKLFIGSSITVGIVVLSIFYATGSTMIYAGTTPIVFTLLMASIILYPDMEVMLFLTIPIKARSLILIALAATLLMDISNGQILYFIINLAAITYGYIYAILTWGYRSSFKTLYGLETFLFKFSNFFSNRMRIKSNIDVYDNSGAKIYDFKTGKKILDDNTFLNACLSKIAKEGRASLTFSEKFRLWRISKRISEKK